MILYTVTHGYIRYTVTYGYAQSTIVNAVYAVYGVRCTV